MKRFRGMLCIFVCVLFLINVAAIPASSDEGYGGVTAEPIMPELTNVALMNVDNTSTLGLRLQWLETVITMQEELYNQQVIEVEEDECFITLYFESGNITNEDFLSDHEIIIESVAYLKPEAKNQVLESNVLSVSSTSSETAKIITYWGWEGWKDYGEESCLKSLAYDVLMEFVPTVSKTVDFVIGRALGSIYSSLEDAATVTGKTQVKYYYRNKAGSVYKNGYWYPTAYVGERRSFAWCWGGYRLPGGEAVVDYCETAPSANVTSNPTNYDSREIKDHYFDDAWIIQKAIDTYYSGGYWDAFGQAMNVVEE